MSKVSFSRRLVAIVVLLCVGSIPIAATAKQVVGYVENVVIYPGALKLKAKMDTGAETTSLNCTTCDKTYQKDGKEWVRFRVTNHKGDSIMLEREVIGHTNIRRHAGVNQDRLVISLPICLGGVIKETPVNVIDRTGFNYQILIGRSFMDGDFIVDPAEKFQLKSACPNVAPSN